MLKKLSKKAKAVAVASAVWLIILFVAALNRSGGFHEDFWTIFLLAGALPVLIGWGIRWIRQDGMESGDGEK